MEKVFKCLSYENRKIIEEMLNQGENVTASLFLGSKEKI